MKEKPLIGISACLLGELVRYNKGNTQDKWLSTELAKYVDFYPICPEVEMGLGVPREEIHLYYSEKDPKVTKLRSKFSLKELTQSANETYKKMNEKSDQQEIDGYILMRKSPSCGLSNIKTVSEDGKGNVKLLQGLYAKNLQERYPNIPKQDSGRMKNELLREQFVKTVFAHHRFNKVEKNIRDLQEFHKRYKYILMEHNQNKMRILGKIAANLEGLSVEDVFNKYEELFFQTLAINASIKNRYNVMEHIMGYLKKFLSPEDKQNMLEVLKDYKAGLSKYMVPVNLLLFFIKKNKIDYLIDQYYFNPYPKELRINKIL